MQACIALPAATFQDLEMQILRPPIKSTCADEVLATSAGHVQA